MKSSYYRLIFVSLISLLVLTKSANGFIHPLSIKNRHFIDSVTNEPFFIKGVDYQPGGSSGVNTEKDPLSDADVCARDIILFQELGINTIRVYSVNPNLNHDKCMTLLAVAGIYLVLDINSPLENQHLHRYQPWTTYNSEYLKHVFKVVEVFSSYNNTLGYFAGNEIINDKTSAEASPIYVKGLIRDIKQYILKNSPRVIPVGYSAADDLNFRISLAKYLECSIDGNNELSIDFYGVNSYQWCGKQTFYTSGYNILVDDYKEFTKPLFLSEYGCNEVKPRMFEETDAIYSKDMNKVFCGGLVYEFTQGPNNYGLVDVDDDGNVHILEDFNHLKDQFSKKKFNLNLNLNNNNNNNNLINSNQKIPECELNYDNLKVDSAIPECVGQNELDSLSKNKGNFVPLTEEDLITSYTIYDVNGNTYPRKKYVHVMSYAKTGNKQTNSNRMDGDLEKSSIGVNAGSYISSGNEVIGITNNEDTEEKPKKRGPFAFLFRNEGE
ncbi:1,3-beta-glucanosyltransferase [Ascoidea rubescens DSM 1968]|uniref:1,3-beta-glucanosyltransferase n=1 Tax=Ascoidea rubescens DSM 1968 TaxID=1344418 RepID=A0A1D2VGA4_9ASCO|nr:glycoside hydrolase family 72 protein [Ascoidea rubescens DSM 1968]ODV60570.1 glycoside hydrolase family 72 protein [Ascoidea rubescens DSM 1968]